MSKNEDESGEDGEERRGKLVKAGVAVGVGSAAVVAALLYASKVKKSPKSKPASKARPRPDDATD